MSIAWKLMSAKKAPAGYQGIGSLSFVQQVSFGSGLRDIYFRPDGSEITTLTYGTSGLAAGYSLGTSFDISTIGSLVDSRTIGTPISFDYVDEGNKMLFSDFNNRMIEVYNLNTPYRASSFTTTGSSTRVTGINQYHVRMKPDGSRVYWNNSSTNQIIQEDVSPPFVVANGANRVAMSYAETGSVFAFDINSTGEFILFADSAGILREYPLSTPYDVTTAGTPQTLNVSANVGAPYSVRYADNDTKVIVMDRVANTLTEYA